ncbi:MAG: T9SS type A sorting domain-containing protein [Candidatus Krumholzibacteriota bacterium]|nr:T9SS type A sorting domain-containing protein [Candidatus Krumholzibacteriota bacterium]
MKVRIVLPVTVVAVVLLLAAGCLHARWPENGLLVKQTAEWHIEQISVSDGADGVIIVWAESDTGSKNIYAQRIDKYGSLLWQESGVVVCDTTSTQSGMRIISDGNGGAIIIWSDKRNGFWNLYAQKINEGGKILWATYGVPITTSELDRSGSTVVTDRAGGAIVTWFDYRNVETDIFAQRIDSGGNVLWTPEGIPVCDAADHQFYPSMIEDGSGGAIIVWKDDRGVDADVYAQRVNSGGLRQWITSGVVVCSAAGNQFPSRIISDSAGGAVVLWLDDRDGNDDLYSQRISGDGACLWAADGLAVCTYAAKQDHGMMALSDCGKIFFTWQDSRNGSDYDIYAQLAETSGTIEWPTDGVVVCDEINNQSEPHIFSCDPSRLYISWEDERRYPMDSDVYIQKIDTFGYHGYAEPVIEHIEDLPEDQGGWVRMAIRASDYDMAEETVYPVTGYNVWRRIDSPSEAAYLVTRDKYDLGVVGSVPSRPLESINVPGVVISSGLAMILGLPPGEWESLGFHAATQEKFVNIAAPTRSDSVAGDYNWETYLLTAHTTTPSVYFTSLADSAYSVDNIPPAQPTGFIGEPVIGPPGLLLSWDPNVEPDLWGYYLYRGSNGGFIPGPANYLGSTTDVTFTDNYSQWSSSYYKIAAVDYQGNMSPYALLSPENITGEDNDGLPDADYLAQNYPNPFNPHTVIRIGLIGSSDVELGIYNVKGELVRMLVKTFLPSGHYTYSWGGRDAGESPVSSGIYFYRLVAGDFVRTKKMVLLR